MLLDSTGQYNTAALVRPRTGQSGQYCQYWARLGQYCQWWPALPVLPIPGPGWALGAPDQTVRPRRGILA